MNIVKKQRERCRISLKEMARFLKVSESVYRYMEEHMCFTVLQYKKVCIILDIDYDKHL